MDNSFYLMVAGQQYITNKVNTIANNIANINTHGFQRDNFLAIKQTVNMRNKYMHAMKMVDYPKDHSTYKTLAKGVPQVTDHPFDLYIGNTGYFAIRDQYGQQLYSRAGRFSLSPDGSLVDNNSNAVLSVSGNSINLSEYSKSLEIKINNKGVITAGGRYIDTIAVIKFDNPQMLRKVGDSYMSNTKNIENILQNDPNIKQFHIETSNVNSVKESVELIRAKNDFELMQELISLEFKRRTKLLSAIENTLQ